MASTYVNDLRLNEMATGDASGSWGTVTNTNLELIGEAFSYGTETIGDADSTLTIADGAADAARSFYLKITSSVDLTTTRIVTLGPNTVSKVWMIENATTGSQVITIKQGSGATINVPNGQVKMISTDGAGSGGAVLDLLVDVDLTGTTTLVNLDVSGTLGVTGVLTATSLDISGDIDVDGTTNLDVVDIDGAVDMASTLLVTGVLTTTAATVFNGGFASNADSTLGTDKKVQFRDAAIYINSSVDGQLDIVADTEIQIAATTVDVNGALDVSGTALVTGVLTTTAATVSNGGGQFNGTVTVGVDDTGYDVKFFGATAGKYMLWDESADTLEVSGTVVAGAGTALLPSITTTGDLNTGMWFPAADTIAFSEGGVEALRIDSSGSVGIGTSSLATGYRLTVSGTAGTDDIGLAIADTVGKTFGVYSSGNKFHFSDVNAAAIRLTIDTSGNVGIGTTSPTNLLHLYKASGGNYSIIENTSGKAAFGVGSGGEVTISAESATNVIRFLNNSGATERMKIDSTGAVTMPAQPAFSAVPTAAQLNIAINTEVTVVFGTEVFDVGANFASNTFTAPVTGKYQLNVSIYVNNLDTGADYYQVSLKTSNRTYQNVIDPGVLASDPVYWTQTLSILADMDASDTAYIFFQQGNGTVQTDITSQSRFSGFLAC
jgi:hypothetical protein